MNDFIDTVLGIAGLTFLESENLSSLGLGTWVLVLVVFVSTLTYALIASFLLSILRFIFMKLREGEILALFVGIGVSLLTAVFFILYFCILLRLVEYSFMPPQMKV